jgi:hypothetical protein
MLSPEKLLERADASARLLSHARNLARLGAILPGVIPPELAREARVVNARAGMVVVHVANGAVAAKLRQLGPRLVAHFAQSGFECNEIKIKVQPSAPPSSSPHFRPPPISAASARSLVACADALPEDAPLKNTLRRLAKHAVDK